MDRSRSLHHCYGQCASKIALLACVACTLYTVSANASIPTPYCGTNSTHMPNGICNQTRFESFSVTKVAQNIDFDLNRLFQRTHYQATFYCAGDDERVYQRKNKQYGTWVQGFDINLDQAEKDSVAGYHATGRGIVIGADREFNHNFKGGFAYAYSKAHTDAKDIAQNTLDVSSQQGLLYGRYRICDIYYSGVVSFALNQYGQERNIIPVSCDPLAPVPAPDLILNDESHFTGWQFNGKLEAGYEFHKQYEKITAYAVPHVMVTYGHVRTHAYQEVIDGGVGIYQCNGLNVQNEPLDDAKLGLGILFSYDYLSSRCQYTPYFRLLAMQAILNENQATYANFNEPEASGFSVYGVAPPKYTYMAGIGLAFNFKNNSYLMLEYDYEGKTGTTMHAGFLKYRIQWC